MVVTLNIKNEIKAINFLNFIKTLDYIEVKEFKNEPNNINKNDLKQFIGMWKDRDISINDIREKAWKK